MQRGVYINYDLENTPLQIKTDSVVGSDEEMKVYFYTAGNYQAGGVFLYFSSPPQYRLKDCSSSSTDFPTALPTETDKIWTLTRTRTSGTIRIIIQCNNKEVLNIVLSDTTCSESDWSSDWRGDAEKMMFLKRASDFYRPGINHVTFFSCLLSI